MGSGEGLAAVSLRYRLHPGEEVRMSSMHQVQRIYLQFCLFLRKGCVFFLLIYIYLSASENLRNNSKWTATTRTARDTAGDRGGRYT